MVASFLIQDHTVFNIKKPLSAGIILNVCCWKTGGLKGRRRGVYCYNKLSNMTLVWHLLFNMIPADKGFTPKNTVWVGGPWTAVISFKLIKKHFTVNHRFYKIFNKNTIKLSYSCMPSVGSAIKQHNSKLLNPTNTDALPCNCQDKTKCPVPNARRTKAVVYTAVVTAEDVLSVSIMAQLKGKSKQGYQDMKHHSVTASMKKKPLCHSTSVSWKTEDRNTK